MFSVSMSHLLATLSSVWGRQNPKMFPKLAAPGVHIALPNLSISHQSRACCEGIVQVQMKSESVDLKIGRFFSDFITWTFSKQNFLHWWKARKSERWVPISLEESKRPLCTLLGGGVLWHMPRKCEWARAVSIWQLAGKMGTSILQPQGSGFC